MCTSNFNRCVWMWLVERYASQGKSQTAYMYLYIFENHTTHFQESKIICWKKESGIISCARHAVENGIHFIYFSRNKNVNRIHQINDINAKRIGLKQSGCLCFCFCVSSSRMDLIINIFFVFLSALIM